MICTPLAIPAPSPNHNERRGFVDMLVMHYTGMKDGASALARLCDPVAEVSAHYVVAEDGQVFALVEESRRAWHAGAGQWQGDQDLNSASIGIEIVNGGHNFPVRDGGLPPYPERQIISVISLCQGILGRHGIVPSRIVGHSDIAPLRKEDPGEHFPWKRLAENGIGIWPTSSPSAGMDAENNTVSPADLSAERIGSAQRQLSSVGYGLTATSIMDATTVACITAFQRRFVPDRVSGDLDAATLHRINEVAHALSDKASLDPLRHKGV